MTAFATVPAGSLAATRAVATISTTTSFTPYKHLVLSVGSRGAAVRTLQRALGGIAVDGVFGSVTRAKVSAFQLSLARPQTGLVTPDLWEVLEAREFPFRLSFTLSDGLAELQRIEAPTNFGKAVIARRG